jgi:DNA-binding NarL/FixJ family response regulator
MTSPRPLAALITGPIRPLTKQQQRVCDGIYRGLTYAQIGAELGALEGKESLSEHTVRAYLRDINRLFRGMERMDPKDRIYLAMELRRRSE